MLKDIFGQIMGGTPIDDHPLLEGGVWIDNGGIFSVAPEVKEILPSGCYRADVDGNGRVILIKQDVNTDDLVLVSDSTSDKILREIETFWTLREMFDKYGFVYKRGILLAGPPGGGKTVTINLIVEAIVNKYNGVAVYMGSPKKTVRGLQDLRSVEADRPLVVIIEDIDDVIDTYGEIDILDLLDGGTQINNVVFIATTNHVSKLEDRIIKRPSRFDTVEFVLPPTASVRKQFFIQKDPLITDEEATSWADKTEGLSFAHLKEIIILKRCFGQDIDTIINKFASTDVKKQEQEFASETNTKHPLGFNTTSVERAKTTLTETFNK